MSGRKVQVTPTPAAVEAAAQWFLRLQQETLQHDSDNDNGQTFIDWQRWLAAAPEHRLAYEQIEDAALCVRQIPGQAIQLPTTEEMARDRYDGTQSIREWKTARRQPRFATRYALAASIVGAIALGAGFFVTDFSAPQTDTLSYQTTAGEQKTIELSDGSKITLDADSQLNVNFGADHRTLRLSRGEAFFEVAHDPHRPFKVDTGSTQVLALGTAFNIRLSGNRTIVAVTEGKVQVTAAPTQTTETTGTVRLAAQLSAGESVSYSNNGNLHAMPAAETALATGWLEGRRQYRNEPLRYVLADVDRYTGRRIHIEDETTGELKFTGTLNLQNSAAWLQGLSVALPVSITQNDDGTLSVKMDAAR